MHERHLSWGSCTRALLALASLRCWTQIFDRVLPPPLLASSPMYLSLLPSSFLLSPCSSVVSLPNSPSLYTLTVQTIAHSHCMHFYSFHCSFLLLLFVLTYKKKKKNIHMWCVFRIEKTIWVSTCRTTIVEACMTAEDKINNQNRNEQGEKQYRHKQTIYAFAARKERRE